MQELLAPLNWARHYMPQYGPIHQFLHAQPHAFVHNADNSVLCREPTGPARQHLPNGYAPGESLPLPAVSLSLSSWQQGFMSRSTSSCTCVCAQRGQQRVVLRAHCPCTSAPGYAPGKLLPALPSSRRCMQQQLP